MVYKYNKGEFMKHDLIIIGGGPAGLMAAKTAAEEGLKVLLIERKRKITEINRDCTQAFYLHKVTSSPETEEGKTRADGYIEPVSVELLPDKCRFHFLDLGFSLDYYGSYTPYYDWIDLSPSKHQIHRHKPNDKIWALYYNKEVFLSYLLISAQKAGAEFLPGTIGIKAENTPDGVNVLVRDKSGEKTLKARTVIAADGIASTIADNLGLNKDRQVMAPSHKVLEYYMEGVETDLHPLSFVWITIPSLNPHGNVWIGLREIGIKTVGTVARGSLSATEILEAFMKHPNFAPWFRHARLVRKMTTHSTAGLRTPIREPIAGNVMVVGDAGAPAETWIQGAIACGYKAIIALKKQLDGEKGYSEYISWWQKAFAFNNPHYWKVARVYPLQRCSDEEVDYLYSLFKGRIGCAMGLINQNLHLVKKERPDLYERLTTAGT
jgi:flavin-dependent dehydrogenase